MYKNRMRHATPKLSPNGLPKFFIRHSDIALEKRVRYIESVCQVLIESRFGPGRVEPVVINFSDSPELDPVHFYDLCDEEQNRTRQLMPPFHSLSPLGRKSYRPIEAASRRAKQAGLWDVAPSTRTSLSPLTPTQGRGSP